VALRGGQWWAMHDGNYGIPGIRGNLESVSYRFAWRCVGSNPTLSAKFIRMNFVNFAVQGLMKGLLYVLVISGFWSGPWRSPLWAQEKDATTAESKKNGTPADRKPEKDTAIGTATMTKDGTIILHLRSKEAHGTIAEARLVYRKSDKHYSEVLKHLGGLKPGQSKPVPPWPDQEKN
jgi:hypothetical protein